VKDLPVIDSFQFFGPSDTPALVDFRVEWEATGSPVTRGLGSTVAPTDPRAFLGEIATAVSTASFSGSEIGFEFETIRRATTSPRGYAQIGTERNGVFLKQVRGAQIGGVFSEDNGHNGIALRGAENILISRCISRGNSHHGFDSIENGKKITYANNVSYANGSSDQDKGLYVTATEGITLLNNILFENAGDQLAFSNEGGNVSDIASDHNLVYRSDGDRLVRWFSDYYSDLAAYQAKSGQDAASLSADPRLTAPKDDNYTPLPDSPVIDAGTEIAQVTDGYSGKAPDIGAIEYRT